MTTILTARDARLVSTCITPKLPRRAAVTVRRLWRAYWNCQVRRATVVLQKLDDGTLAHIGIDRGEIELLVDDGTGARVRRFR